jgi:hypothetical protein
MQNEKRLLIIELRHELKGAPEVRDDKRLENYPRMS